MFAWLECVDCLNGQLDSVRALAARKPAAVDTLAGDLLDGPPAARVLRVEQQLAAGFDRLRTYANARQIPLATVDGTNKSARVARYRERYRTVFAVRAALALGCIRTSRALQALDSARGPLFPPAVRTRAEYAMVSLDTQSVRDRSCHSRP